MLPIGFINGQFRLVAYSISEGSNAKVLKQNNSNNAIWIDRTKLK